MVNNLYIDLLKFYTDDKVARELWAKPLSRLPIITAGAELILNRIPRGDLFYLVCDDGTYSTVFPKIPGKRHKTPEVEFGYKAPNADLVVDIKHEPQDYEITDTNGQNRLTIVYDMARIILTTDATIGITVPE